jgi:YVTN family beta-propeller protein
MCAYLNSLSRGSAFCLLLVLASVALPAQAAEDYLSPTALVGTKDGKTLFIACPTGNCVLRFDTVGRRVVESIAVPASPSGLALSADEGRLYVTCAAVESKVLVIGITNIGASQSSALRASAACATIPAGHTAMGPVLSADGKTLYVCNRFNDSVGVIDLAAGKEVGEIPVRREPVAAALTQDGKFLLVANHLHNGRADAKYVTAMVSVIDLAQGRVTREFVLPDGSSALSDIRISPDGRYAVVTHILAQHREPAADLHFRWINGNALTVIDLGRMEILASTLLDERGKGAANPWGLAWTADGSKLVVAHAGTHELSVIDFPVLLKKLLELPAPFDALKAAETADEEREPSDYSVPFFPGLRQRVNLPAGDLGPRAVAVVGRTVYAANYFSDTLTALDLSDAKAKPESIPLRPQQGKEEVGQGQGLKAAIERMSLVRKGEFYFHDATICFRGWQSCSSCHPGDARADGLNWDLLNDGVGNPKNTKSILLAFQTPPEMWLGVRETAGGAVRAGIKHILFTDQPEAVASAIDEYIKSLKPVPSPHLVHGELSNAAKRGKEVFTRAGCAACHPPGLFTDLRQYDVGTRASYDKRTDEFHTPTLIEIWRTAPYLHDGSAATIRDVLTTRNPRDQHGKTSDLSASEIDDLAAYLLSL